VFNMASQYKRNREVAVPLVRIPGLRIADSEVTSFDGSGV